MTSPDNNRHHNRKWLQRQPPTPAELADRAAIGQLAHIYAYGIDARDLDLVLSVFDPAGTGAGAVKDMPLHDYLRAIYAGAAAFETTQHTLSNQYITFNSDNENNSDNRDNRDSAEMLTYGVAYHIRPRTDPAGNLTVGVHYHDHCRRTEDGWVIDRRRAAMQWVDGVLPGTGPGTEDAS